MVSIRIIVKFIQHFLTARNTNGFGVHSPFVYQFTQLVLREKHYFYIFSEIEKLRNNLKSDHRTVKIIDFGTGSDRISTVSEVLKKSVSDEKLGQLLFRISHYFKFKSILELGTSLGVTTSYLASSSTDIKCITIDGSSELSKIAAENLKKLELNNVEFVVGNIDEVLLENLSFMQGLDLVFVDANHQSKAVLNYFAACLTKAHNNTIFVFDDIYWSADMENAWQKIKENSEVSATIDLFHFGIVFCNKDLQKKHYKMRF